MTGVFGAVNWLWLLVGLAAGFWLVPRLIAKFS